MAIIEVRGLHKSFWIPADRRDTVRERLLAGLRPNPRRELRVLSGVDFEVRAGEMVGVMGRNGSGKSTLLKLVCGIYQPDGGDVLVREPVTPILELGIGWNPELDAVDNTVLLATIMGATLGEARELVPRVLSFSGIGAFARMPLRHFSSGMTARLAYAIAFEAASGVLVLDEVFAVGDVGFRSRCEARFTELRRAGQTGLLVSHDPRTIEQFCDRALLIDEGRVVRDGDPSSVSRAYVELLSGHQARDEEAPPPREGA